MISGRREAHDSVDPDGRAKAADRRINPEADARQIEYCAERSVGRGGLVELGASTGAERHSLAIRAAVVDDQAAPPLELAPGVNGLA